MTQDNIQLISRKSPLAIKQVDIVLEFLKQHLPHQTFTHQKIQTKGDRFLNLDIMKLGGKGVFVTEIEKKLSDNTADIAVHSLKDVPANLDKSFALYYPPVEADTRDALVSAYTFNELPKNAIVGTSSLRRQLQLQSLRPDLQMKPIRGSLETRLSKLDNQEFDAIVLAKAGLDRLNLSHRIQYVFETEEILPSPCQGVIGLQILHNNPASEWLSSVSTHTPLFKRVSAERTLISQLGGNCTLPLGALGRIQNNLITLEALLIDPISKKKFYSQQSHEQANHVAQLVYEDLLSQGANKTIEQFS